MRNRLAFVTAAVLALALAGGAAWWWQGRHDSAPLAAVTLRPVIDGQQAVVLAGQQSGRHDLVIVLHGLGGSAGLVEEPKAAAFTRRLVADGFVVAASDAHGDAWGDAASQADYVRLHQWVAQRFDIDRTVLVSSSMGAIAGLQLAAHRDVPRLAGWVGVSPVIDLPGAARSGPLRDDVDLSPEQLRALDPSRVPGRALRGLPMAVVISPADGVVSVPAAERFARRTGARLVTCSGGHAAEDCFRAAVVENMLP